MEKQIVLQETAHGKRYWSTTTDPQLLNDVVKAYPPYLLNDEYEKNGYVNEDDAIQASCEIQGIELDGWIDGTWRPDDLMDEYYYCFKCGDLNKIPAAYETVNGDPVCKYCEDKEDEYMQECEDQKQLF